MSLFYPKLKLDATLSIWASHLARVEEIWGTRLKITEGAREDILRFAQAHFNEQNRTKSPWNGRQIRNAFQTAIALAEYQAQQDRIKYELKIVLPPCLEKIHFEKVAKASRHFDQYLEETVGSTGTLALEAHERRDDLDENDIAPQVSKLPKKMKGAKPSRLD